MLLHGRKHQLAVCTQRLASVQEGITMLLHGRKHHLMAPLHSWGCATQCSSILLRHRIAVCQKCWARDVKHAIEIRCSCEHYSTLRSTLSAISAC